MIKSLPIIKMTEDSFISRHYNLFGIDLRLKEKVIVYLSDNPKRIAHAKDTFLPIMKNGNVKYFYIDCSYFPNPDLSLVQCIDVDEVIIDFRDPMREIAETLVNGDRNKIVDDRIYNLSDDYERKD